MTRVTGTRAMIAAAVLLFSSYILFTIPPPASAEAWVKTDLGIPSDSVHFFGVAAGDGDRDGNPEVYFTSPPGPASPGQVQGGGAYQYTWDSSGGNWTIENIGGQGFGADAIVFGDGDDSGDRELYMTGINQQPPRKQMAIFQLYHDSGGWHQETVAASSNAAVGNGLAIGDGNNDSRTELFSCGGDGHIYMYSKSNSWNTQDVGNATPPPNKPSTPMDSVAVGDGDNNGYPEVYGSAATGWVYRFVYTGSSWTRTDVGQGGTGASGSDMAHIVIGDADSDGKNEVYGASYDNATIYMFRYNPGSSQWERTALVSLGSRVNALSLAMGDGDSNGRDELYSGTSNNQIYRIFIDNSTSKWASSSVGSGNGPINAVVVGSAAGVTGQKEVYAACGDGHGYQFLVDRTPPPNPTVWSDTHPNPGTWYASSVVHVLWKDAGSDASGFDGYSYSWDNSPSTVPDDVKEVEESVHEASSPALSPGKWYFHLRARDNSLNWNSTAAHFGPICIGTAPDTTPPTLSDIQVTGITDKLAVVSWSTNEPADSLVEYGTGTVYTLKVYDASYSLGHGLTLTGLSPSTVYHFRVGSKDASGNGPAYSGDYNFITLAAPDTSPPVISNIAVSGLTDRVAIITWETNEPADSAVEFGLSTGYGTSMSDAKFVLLHEMKLSGLNASTTYHFRVKSKDATGNGPAMSLDLTFTTLAVPDKTPPVITNTRAEGITDKSATVLWETDEVADSFLEYGPNTSYGLSSADNEFTLHHSLLLQGLSTDATYHVRAMSADPSGNMGIGADVTFRTAKTPSQPDKKPPEISGLEVSALSDRRAVVLWTTDELADSLVEYGLSTTYGSRTSDTTFTTSHSVLLENLQPSTSYHLIVKSVDVFGNGPTSSQDVNFTTTATPDTSPPRISGIKVTNITKSGAAITWTTDEPATSVLDYGNGTGYGNRLTSTLNVLQHRITLTGLSSGKTYHLRVASTDPSGNAAQPSTDQTFTTLTVAPVPPSPPQFPWLWVLLALLVAACVVGAVLAYRRYSTPAQRAGAPARPAAYRPPGAYPSSTAGPRPPATAPRTSTSTTSRQVTSRPPTPPYSQPARSPRSQDIVADSSEEEVETLEMEDADVLSQVTSGRTAAAVPAARPPPSRAQPSPPTPTSPRAPPPTPAPASTRAPPSIPPPTPLRHIRCPSCKSRIPLFEEGPQRVTCPGCGRSGPYRPKAPAP